MPDIAPTANSAACTTWAFVLTDTTDSCSLVPLGTREHFQHAARQANLAVEHHLLILRIDPHVLAELLQRDALDRRDFFGSGFGCRLLSLFIALWL